MVLKSSDFPQSNFPFNDRGSIDKETLDEIKEMKKEDDKVRPKVDPKFIWDNDIREDRTAGWE